MICANCHHSSNRVRIVHGVERCSFCAGFSEAGGMRLDGVLSRQRVASEAVKYEGDTLNPWKYDKNEKAFTPNDDFVKLHGNNAHNFFTPDDVAKSHPKLAAKIKNKQNALSGDDGIGEGEYIPAATDLINDKA